MKSYRGPLAALVIALVLFGAVLLTRPTTPPIPTPSVLLITATARPIILTPAPTIPIQRIDTSALNEALVGSPKKLNPLLAGFNHVDQDICALIFEGLLTTDATGATIPGLASAMPEVSSDGLTYVVTLRADVLWQDGVPFNATDVLFTIGLLQDAAFPGASDLHTFWSSIEVEKLDEHTIRFGLPQPLASFPDSLRIGILPEHVLRGTSASHLATHPFNLAPIGTGAYQFDSWLGSSNALTGIKLRLAATFRARPEGKSGYALDRLIFHFYPTFDAAVGAFQRGDVFSISELSPETLQQVGAITELQIYPQYRAAFGSVIYNWQNPNTAFFRDLRMRQALAESIDRNALVTRYLGGRALPAASPILPNSWAFDPTVDCAQIMPLDPAKAKDALAHVQLAPTPTTSAATAAATTNATAAVSAPPTTAPVTDAPGTFRFQLLVGNDPALVGMAQDIIKNWTAIGLTVQIVVTDTATLNARLTSGDFDAALVELNLSPSADPDPYSLWRQPPSDGGLNFGSMNERTLGDLLEQARRESSNGVQRAVLYHQFQRIFCERAAALLLYYPIYAYGADARISGIQLGFIAQPSDRFRTLRDWKFGP